MSARRYKGWAAWLLMLGAAVALLLVGILRDSGPRSESDRIDAITKRIACPVCAGESVFESRNAAAVNIRNKVQDLVEEGRLDDDAIIATIQQDSPVRLLLVPERTGIDALAWALPVAAGVVAFVGLGLVFRRWRRAADTVPTEADRALVDAARHASATDEPEGVG